MSEKPTSPHVSERYSGDQGVRYVRERHADPSAFGYELNARYFAPWLRESYDILDYGCGNGGMLPHLAKFAANVEGLEVNPAAREIGQQSGFTVYGSLDEIPADRRYHAIVSNHVLEHVPDVCNVLTRLRHWLVPGGMFITKLPIDDIRAKHQQVWSADDVDHHLQTWTPRLFANVLHESGYEVESIKIVTSAWHSKLFWLRRFGLDACAFWAFAVLRHRRQLFAVARAPGSDS